MRNRNHPLAYVAAAGTLLIGASYAGLIALPWFPPDMVAAVAAASVGLLGAVVTWGNTDPARRNTGGMARLDGLLSLVVAGCAAIIAARCAGILPVMFGGTSMPLAYAFAGACLLFLLRAGQMFSIARRF